MAAARRSGRSMRRGPGSGLQGRTGFMAAAGHIDGLRRIVLESAYNLKALRGMRPACRQHIETHFSCIRQAGNFVSLYEGLLASRKRLAQNGAPTAVGANSALHFERNLGSVLKRLFDADRNLLGLSETLGAAKMRSTPRQRLTRQLRRILKRAVRDSWTYDRLRTALTAAFGTVQARPGAERLLASLRRLFRPG